MRMKLIHELSEIWRKAENILPDNEVKALGLKDEFVEKSKKLTDEELVELYEIIDGDAG